MKGCRKSDRLVVPEKPPNEERDASGSEEEVEERGLAKGKALQHTRDRTQSRRSLSSEAGRLRQAARRCRKKGERLTALFHHVYSFDRLRECYYELARNTAAGVDGETWRVYGEDVETRLRDLSDRLRRGAYRAPPVKRAYVPKTDGQRRPIGIPTVEDRVVQRSMAGVLSSVFEEAFLGFSYGYRQGRNQHNALDAVYVGITKKKVNWVLDADIRGFFDAIDHDWMIRFLEHRIADRRVIRHVKKWLRAGVMEGGRYWRVQYGTPQGGSVSPVLANVYLHYVYDLWVAQWRRRKACGDMIMVRYADDLLLGFQHRYEAERYVAELHERLGEFGLELSMEKTRLLEFGCYAAERRKRRGEGKPETFDFLGFTHICSTDRHGEYALKRITMRKRFSGKLKSIRLELRRRRHFPVHEVGFWLRQVMRGYFEYYAVPHNFRAICRFRWAVKRLWQRELSRRSQKGRVSWARMKHLERRWLPYPRILHPYPNQRLRVTT